MSSGRKPTQPNVRHVLDRSAKMADPKEKYLRIIRGWQLHWSNFEPGYELRAFTIDANMKHDLARRLADAESSDARPMVDSSEVTVNRVSNSSETPDSSNAQHPDGFCSKCRSSSDCACAEDECACGGVRPFHYRECPNYKPAQAQQECRHELVTDHKTGTRLPCPLCAEKEGAK